jgi:hypothetical protein
MSSNKKRKVTDEGRIFNEKWTAEYDRPNAIPRIAKNMLL